MDTKLTILDTEPYPGQISGLKVLLVEDVNVNQRIAQQTLVRGGCEVEIAGNGQVAVNLVQQFSYDLVLMDLQMPVMDGATATRKIRRMHHGKYRNLPIIALTASEKEELDDTVRSAGFDYFVCKPLKSDEIFDKISNAVHRKIEEPRTVSDGQKFAYLIGLVGEGKAKDILRLSRQTCLSAIVEIQEGVRRSDESRVRKSLHLMKPNMKYLDLEAEFSQLTDDMYSGEFLRELRMLKYLVAKTLT